MTPEVLPAQVDLDLKTDDVHHISKGYDALTDTKKSVSVILSADTQKKVALLTQSGRSKNTPY